MSWVGLLAFAQEGLEVQNIDWCPEIEFDLLGQHEVKKWPLYEYSLNYDDDASYSSWLVVSHVIQQWETEIASFAENSFSYEFPETWVYTVRSSVILENWCEYGVEKSIDSYTSMILYLWEGSDVLDLASWELKGDEGWDGDRYDLLVKEISTDNFSSDDKQLSHLSTFAPYFRHADSVLIDTSSQWQLFENLGKVFSINDIENKSADVYVIADITQSYFRRLLARYVTAAWIEKVYVTQDQNFWSLFTSLVLWENPQKFDFIKEYSVSLDTSNRFMFLSYMTDSLLFNGFPLWIVILVLLLPFVGLVISIARQIVWLSVFWVFTPLLFALSMFVIWVYPALLLLLTASIAVIIANRITKHLYLLYSPKISLMLILYCMFTLFGWWLHNKLALNRVDVASYADSFAVFPFVSILIVAKWVFSDSFLQFKKWWWMTLVEFVLISFLVFYMLNSDYLQNIFLGNPELILLVFILNILVWRFTGLQFLEYFRFLPLIKNYFEEE